MSSLLIFASIISLISAQCGSDCQLCADSTACGADPNCFYLTDTNSCQIAGVCASDCALCSDESSCDSGAGGNCFWSNSSGTCFGSTCDTNCEECYTPGLCANSNVPPNGCVFESIGGGELWYLYMFGIVFVMCEHL